MEQDRIVGPFKCASADCHFVISVVGYFSKWAVVAFCSDVSSRTIVGLLLSIFAREGCPIELASDHGPQFTSREDGEIKHSLLAMCHPRANGQVERFNRVVKSYIELATLEQHPVKNTVTEYSGIYRATPHSTTGRSPAVLLHGRHKRTSLDIIDHPTKNFADTAQEICSLRKRVKERQHKSKDYADRQRAA